MLPRTRQCCSDLSLLLRPVIVAQTCLCFTDLSLLHRPVFASPAVLCLSCRALPLLPCFSSLFRTLRKKVEKSSEAQNDRSRCEKAGYNPQRLSEVEKEVLTFWNP